jgi:hypothetical protein
VIWKVGLLRTNTTWDLTDEHLHEMFLVVMMMMMMMMMMINNNGIIYIFFS